MSTDSNHQSLSEITRREVLDLIHDRWSGRLGDDDFLSRLYDLEALPSYDHRFPTASGDIYKHRIMNDDWEPSWVFTDKRFDILRGPDEAFLRFIAETVHPIVRPDQEEAKNLVDAFNAKLEPDGWQLVRRSEISGRPVYGPVRIGHRETVAEEPTGWPKVDQQIQHVRSALQQAVSETEFQAVGLVCREVLISTAQTVYSREEHPPLDGAEPSETDFERMIAAIIAVELKGGANEEARAHAKAALKLAVALQHKRTADYRTAALCAEATFSVVNIVAIMFGRRHN